MNNSTPVVTFIVGIFCGMASMSIINLMALNLTPEMIQFKIHTEAVDLGYGKWIIDQSRIAGGSPSTYFEWITNSVSK
jgi:hypothetical protein